MLECFELLGLVLFRGYPCNGNRYISNIENLYLFEFVKQVDIVGFSLFWTLLHLYLHTSLAY